MFTKLFPIKTFWRFFSPKNGRNLANLVEFRVQKGHLLVGIQCPIKSTVNCRTKRISEVRRIDYL